MILDSLDNWAQYSAAPAWRAAFEFLTALGPDAEPGQREVLGRDVFVNIFEFETKNLLDTVLEAHRDYVDIHVALTGPEVQGRFSLAEVEEKTPYDPESDSLTHHHPDRFNALFTLSPGMFAAYFPQDAHLTQGKTDPFPAARLKAVAKVRAALLRP